MAQRITRKQLLKQDDISEAAFDFSIWIEENWGTVLKWAGGVLLLVLAVVAGVLLVNSRRVARETLLADAQTKFQKALASDFANDGDVSAALSGFDEVIAKSGETGTGQVALYLKAATLGKLDRMEEAIAAAEKVVAQTSGPATLLTSGELLLIDLYTRAGRARDAIARLSANLESTTPVIPTEQALLELGRIHQNQGDMAEARKAWKRLVDEFPGSRAAGEARNFLGPDA